MLKCFLKGIKKIVLKVFFFKQYSDEKFFRNFAKEKEATFLQRKLKSIIGKNFPAGMVDFPREGVHGSG